MITPLDANGASDQCRKGRLVCLTITRKSGELAVLVAFDMFGTLADTASVASELASFCGDMAGRVARTWRDEQLEYMFRVTRDGPVPAVRRPDPVGSRARPG
jgi:hypothetical protein